MYSLFTVLVANLIKAHIVVSALNIVFCYDISYMQALLLSFAFGVLIFDKENISERWEKAKNTIEKTKANNITLTIYVISVLLFEGIKLFV